jgi:hypothetical protein
MIKRLFTVSLLCLGASAFAQTPGAIGTQKPAAIGKVADVEGVVTVSDGVTVNTAVRGRVIIEGNRFVTASSGTVHLSMDNGCDIKLKPNESLLVESGRSCAALWALIQPVGGNVAAAGVGAGAGLGRGLLAGGGLLLAAGLANNGGSSGGTPTPGGGGGGIPVVPPISGL